MDTISRENNSMLPVGALIVGVIGLLLGGYSAAIGLPNVKKAIAAQEEKLTKVDNLENNLNSVSATAEQSKKDISSLSRTTQEAFNTVAADLGNIHASITKIEDAAKKPAAAGKGAKGGPARDVVAGPGEYIVKPGDTFSKIGKANGGFSSKEVAAVNPDVNPAKLHVGQKIKLPVAK